MSRRRLLPALLVVLGIVVGSLAGSAPAAPTADGPLPPLRQLAAAQGIRFGTAVDPVVLASDASYREVLGREFDMAHPRTT